MNEINKLFYDDKYYLLGFNKFYQKIKEKILILLNHNY